LITQEEVIASLKRVYDPEIPVNIYDLGLVYGIETEPDSVLVRMTLTSQGCPSAQQIPMGVADQIRRDHPSTNVKVEVVWNPPWGPHLISEEGKKILGLDDESMAQEESDTGY
jgi:metal-sulfur cluster biosynthetic enzyme